MSDLPNRPSRKDKLESLKNTLKKADYIGDFFSLKDIEWCIQEIEELITTLTIARKAAEINRNKMEELEVDYTELKKDSITLYEEIERMKNENNK